MSDAPPPPNPEQQPSESAKDAKARAKGEKAYAKASRPWYKKKRFIIPGVFLVIIIAVSAAGTGGDDDTGDDVATEQNDDGGQENVPEEVPDDADEASVGEAASDGQFTFTVNGLECGETTIGGGGPFEEEAQGQFCMLDLTVENTGNEARSLSASDQYLYDDQDRRFSSDLSYALAMETPIYEEINPGNSLDGVIAFDVPEGATIVLAELHDSPFSGGVVIELN